MKRLDPILILLFLGVIVLYGYQSCNIVSDRDDYKALQDSLDSTNAKIDQLYTRTDHLTKKIDSLSIQKVTIIEKYVPIKQAINRTTSSDSLARFIRSGLDRVFSQ